MAAAGVVEAVAVAAVVASVLHRQLGATYSYRRRYFSQTMRLDESVQALEVLIDHFLPLTKARREELCQLRDRFTLLPHSLNLSLGSADGILQTHLRAVGDVVALMQAPVWSDHLAFTRIGKQRIGHLAPLPRTEEMLVVLNENIRYVQQCIGVPMLVENISAPFDFGDDDLDEPTFLTRVCADANVGLLLDLANLQSSRLEPETFLQSINPSLVRLLHIAGGGYENGVYVDAHDRPIAEATWKLVRIAEERLRPMATIVERDSYLPPFADLCLEIARAQMIHGESIACR